VAGLIIALDQLSKYAITHTFMLGDYVTVTSFFDLVLAHNTGAAFSLFADQAGWQRAFFISTALIASAIIIYLLRRESGSVLFKLALSLILGGALGNLIDRISSGAVTDFIKLPLWPAFNVADMSITFGVLALLYVLEGRRAADEP